MRINSEISNKVLTIATDYLPPTVGGIPEIIQNNENGYIVPPRGVDEAVACIN